MKRLLTLALFAVLLLPAVAQELTVATYNIRNANKGDAERGNGWERRCPWVCGLIEFQGFDIFGSQEVLDGQLHDMLAQLPDYAYIGVGRDDGKAKGEYSPYSIKRSVSGCWTKAISGSRKLPAVPTRGGMPRCPASAHGGISWTGRPGAGSGSSTCIWITSVSGRARRAPNWSSRRSAKCAAPGSS